MRNHFSVDIGNSRCTSIWFDRWHPAGLADTISPRTIVRMGLSISRTMNEIISGGQWRLLRHAALEGLISSLPAIQHSNEEDRVVWVSNDGKRGKYSARQVWDDVRPRHDSSLGTYCLVW